MAKVFIVVGSIVISTILAEAGVNYTMWQLYAVLTVYAIVTNLVQVSK